MEEIPAHDSGSTSVPGTTNEISNSMEPSSLEVPRFLEFKETRSQQIVARLKQLEEKAITEINLMWTSQPEEEKVPKKVVEDLRNTVHQRVLELRTQMIHNDFILVSEVLQILSRGEEHLLEEVRRSMEDFAQTKAEEDENDDDANLSSTSGIRKKAISKMDRKENLKRKKIPYKAVAVLKQWLFDHIQDPYPSNQVKEDLAKKTNLNFKQVHNWFINARGRIWKKMVHQERFGSVVEKLYVQKVNKDKKD